METTKQSKFNLPLVLMFKELEGVAYSIIRGGEQNLTAYDKGSDIDLFCFDLSAFGQKILAFFNQHKPSNEWSLKVRELSAQQVHFDFLCNGKLDLRLDLYGAFPEYNKVCIKPSYFESVVENSVAVSVSDADVTASISVPSRTDDLLLRYIEYVEYYELRPDKIKHLDYIEDQIESSSDQRFDFFARLHHYTDLPKCVPYYPPHSTSKGLPAEALSTKKLVKILWRRMRGKS